MQGSHGFGEIIEKEVSTVWWAIGIAVGVIVMGFLLFLYTLFHVGSKADKSGLRDERGVKAPVRGQALRRK